MHRVLRAVVLLQISFCVVFCASAQSITEGEFGAARPGLKPPPAPAPEAPRPAAEPESRETKTTPAGRRYPYHGTLHSADAQAGTITLAGKKKQRIILITSDTNITRNGNRVRLAEVIPGEKVSGSVAKNAAGLEQAITLRLKGK